MTLLWNNWMFFLVWPLQTKWGKQRRRRSKKKNKIAALKTQMDLKEARKLYYRFHSNRPIMLHYCETSLILPFPIPWKGHVSFFLKLLSPSADGREPYSQRLCHMHATAIILLENQEQPPPEHLFLRPIIMTTQCSWVTACFPSAKWAQDVQTAEPAEMLRRGQSEKSPLLRNPCSMLTLS